VESTFITEEWSYDCGVLVVFVVVTDVTVVRIYCALTCNDVLVELICCISINNFNPQFS
jgi:hypothetical protein